MFKLFEDDGDWTRSAPEAGHQRDSSPRSCSKREPVCCANDLVVPSCYGMYYILCTVCEPNGNRCDMLRTSVARKFWPQSSLSKTIFSKRFYHGTAVCTLPECCHSSRHRLTINNISHQQQKQKYPIKMLPKAAHTDLQSG